MHSPRRLRRISITFCWHYSPWYSLSSHRAHEAAHTEAGSDVQELEVSRTFLGSKRQSRPRRPRGLRSYQFHGRLLTGSSNFLIFN
ncbi:hypothetical protein M378DRAFT_156978 [Amanita muscaria Koide BX008]|uniref:Uncharacterized protein n=1 Tax=Amanita muscaria (strain Koide BX008) TaxID=946122 RepID=A0A0C2X5Y9_AMAMK|nr:hypothetical protein M378DRAFT_156978 [Amanita muscaria Koide BX008]